MQTPSLMNGSCSFQRPTADTFKQVISPSSLANPGGVLFRDKVEPETAIFGDVQQVRTAATAEPLS